METTSAEELGRIRLRFASNLDRIRNLVAVYDEIGSAGADAGAGRNADLLRAAVVLLHATMEDFLRSLTALILRDRGKETFARLRIRFALEDKPRADQLTLADLAAHRGKTVDEVIEAVVRGWLDTKTFNNTNEIDRHLNSIGISSRVANSQYNRLQAMITRRHHIVHRADHVVVAGADPSAVEPISKESVETWTLAVRSLGQALADHLAEENRGPTRQTP